MANTDKKVTEETKEEIASKKPEVSDAKNTTETDKERSFKEGLANNSDTEKNSPQQK